MKNEIQFDRSSIAYQEHVDFNGLDEILVSDPLIKKPINGSVSVNPNAVIGIASPEVPEK
jgi:hypothetical protein